MPMYEYGCQACGHEFEVIVRSGQTPQCPTCSSEELAKRFSVFARPPASTAAAALPAGCGSCDQRGAPGCGLS